MYKIYKITSDHVVDFAAEELKKYLRMMMPRCGEISIKYDPNATDGLKLGLMSDFGLNVSEADDVSLDDILHIDTDENGGIIAGSNVRSVLLSVYRYLSVLGCRWLFPGIDGEFIPTVNGLAPVNYHKMADCRYRGQCNEGAEYQPNMMEAIDFTPKIGMNIFMIEFDNPKVYYDSYYNHRANQMNRDPEPITAETAMQWKRQCEAEMSKRGLQFHDMGHGWSAESFGISSTDGWVSDDTNKIPEESREFVAMINGERKLYGGVALNTNFCMSNPKARQKVVQKVADYAELATNVDYLHIWLADSSNNHCECDECRKMIPTDWYITLMNEVDEELTKRQLDTRIVFICYVDTTWAPEKISLKNPDRFSLLVAAISRDYTEAVDKDLDTSKIEIKPYELNKSPLLASVNEYLAHAKRWEKNCPVPKLVYEYHFWLPQYRDLGVFDSAKIIHEDIIGYKANGCNGLIEDGSQRSFFPNGFAFYVYGSTLFDTSVDFETLKEDYFSHAYGEDWKEVVTFFEKLGEVADYRYMNEKLSVDTSKGKFYNPSLASEFRKIADIVDEFAPFVESHKNMPKRAQTVSYKLLRFYLEYCKGVSKALVLKSLGAGPEACKAANELFTAFGKHETEIEPWYDQHMAEASLKRIFYRKHLY